MRQLTNAELRIFAEEYYREKARKENIRMIKRLTE